jgi:hypothetical protein
LRTEKTETNKTERTAVVDVFLKDLIRNQTQMESMLKNHEYDMIILSSGHSDGLASRLW